MQICWYSGIFLLLGSVLAQDVLQGEILLSRPRTDFTSIEVDGKIYFAGGFENGDRASSNIDVFDIATQTWNNTLRLATARGFITPAVVPPHIYFVGGWAHTLDTKFYLFESGVFTAIRDPQIKDPTQLSIHGTTLTVLGSFNTAFMNLANTTAGWSTNEDLDNINQRIAGGIKFNHENWIFILGGVNVSSRQPVSDAWIFDIDTSNLTRYADVINPIGYVNSTDYTHSVTNNIMAAWSDVNCILFNIDTEKWLNLTIPKMTNVISVPGLTFIFTATGFYSVDWSNSTADPAFTPKDIVYSVSYSDQAAYFVDIVDGEAEMYCTYNGVDWNTTTVSPTFKGLATEYDWQSYGKVLVTKTGFYVVRNCNVSFIPVENLISVMMAHPNVDHLLAISINSISPGYQFQTYDSQLNLMSNEQPIPILPTICFKNILFDFDNSDAFSLETYDTASVYPNMFGTTTLWTFRGNNLVAIVPGSNSGTYRLPQVDIYDYMNNTWLAPTSYAAIAFTDEYLQAFNMNGILGIFTPSMILKFNVTDYTWKAEVPRQDDGTELPSPTIGPLALQLSNVTYLATNSTRMRIISGSTTRLSNLISGSEDQAPVQMIYSKVFNQIFISTSANRIFTWDIENEGEGLFLFPRPTEEEFIMETSGNFVLVSSRSSDKFDYLDLTSSGWDIVTGVNNYFRPASMRSFNFNGTDLILTAGGQDKAFGFYTDSVRIFDISSLQAVPVPQSAPVGSISGPENQPQQDNTALIVGIVVPFSVVLIGGGLLAFFLIRRHKKRKNGRLSTIGLEQQYGQWFIPFSDLTFHEQLGQGGSGQVFKGSWKNTSVALKLSMTQAHSSVISELALMMQLRPHPNVVQLLGFSVHPETDSIVLVIEYCNGGALDEHLFNDKTVVSMKQKLEWLIGISKGLSHLHSNNIVHRDIAARNVLLHQNEAKITDFGMSRIVDDQQQRGTTKSELGPIRWMSPESLKRKEYSAKSDVWSFGIVAYEIIAQQEPHLDRDPIQVGQEIRDSGLTPQLPDTCPSELASVINSCWNMEPSQRPTFEDIISRLESVLAQQV